MGGWTFDEDFVRAARVAEPSARSRENQALFDALLQLELTAVHEQARGVSVVAEPGSL